jgi:hypothetical protein
VSSVRIRRKRHHQADRAEDERELLEVGQLPADLADQAADLVGIGVGVAPLPLRDHALAVGPGREPAEHERGRVVAAAGDRASVRGARSSVRWPWRSEPVLGDAGDAHDHGRTRGEVASRIESPGARRASRRASR